MIEPDVDMTVTLPWRVICRLAVQALVLGYTLDQLVNEALAEHLMRRSRT
jgi:hypothetical protein